MKMWKNFVLFYLGGASYMFLEFLWRGRSHGSMFLLGGVCFRLLGALGTLLKRIPLALKAMLGAGAITLLELMTGLLVNRDYGIWDYRDMPFHFRGQICLPFTLLWMPLTLFGMWLHKVTVNKIFNRYN